MKDASILFSGGPDSTLAALYALEKFDRVHLLTFHHHLMNLTGRQVAVSEELIEIYGKDRIITHLETIDRLYKKCYFTGMTKYICRYRTFYIPWLCGSCKMAMHFKTIDYNMKHNITKTYDGVNIESASYFPAQSLNYIKVFKNICTSYGMQYDCPVYNINETDKETTKYGLKTTKDTKKKHIFF